MTLPAALAEYEYYRTDTGTLFHGNALDVLKAMLGGSVQCCVTSPPYWGLRDYGTAKWEGGDPECDHKNPATGKATWGPGSTGSSTLNGKPSNDSHSLETFKGDICPKCGATRIDAQLGIEKTPEEYVAKMVEIFREVRRVLRDDGTLWLNLGDSYASNWGMGAKRKSSWWSSGSGELEGKGWGDVETIIPPNSFKPGRSDGLKVKDLVGIPWRVAFALQADGWYLRSDIIWSKPTPMPESVKDRPTKSHEYIFLMSKSQKYFYDAEAIREPLAESTLNDGRNNTGRHTQGEAQGSKYFDNPNVPQLCSWYRGKVFVNPESGRNKRSVWTVATKPFPEAHFATFPPKLIEPCILAGTSEKGCCPECGSPWERVVEKEGSYKDCASFRPRESQSWTVGSGGMHCGHSGNMPTVKRNFNGWRPTCNHNLEPVPCTVLDPFMGAGTVALVAEKYGRAWVGIELNPEYCGMIVNRIEPERKQRKLF
ncbi:MAG: site-specific DNA-methyltransferase [Candidatus Omnitrophota bacterium]|jgi:DNA modification methylase